MGNYSTNLTDKQWQVIENIINPQERQGNSFSAFVGNEFEVWNTCQKNDMIFYIIVAYMIAKSRE